MGHESRITSHESRITRAAVQPLIDRALQEDIGSGDLTTQLTIPPDLKGKGQLIAKQRGILCGLPIAQWTFQTIDAHLQFEARLGEGEEAQPGQILAVLNGSVQAILSAERVALNFLQRLSGIATLTAEFVKRAQPYGVIITDTRKTTPTLRLLEKYAVRVGGGRNHRFGLFDAIIIKDNHILAAGSIKQAVERVRQGISHVYKIEVEAQSLQEVEEALEAGADIIMLDNMDLENLRKAVRLAKGKAILEASGGVTLENVQAIAQTGVDVISVGALTHSAPALDISLELITGGSG